MGGLFCNPAGHTTLAQEGVEGEGGWWDVCVRGGGGLYYYLLSYTFATSLRLQADGLSLFSHRQEVSPFHILR